MEKKGIKPIPHSISISPNMITIYINTFTSAEVFVRDIDNKLYQECIVLDVISLNPSIANTYPSSGKIVIQAMEPGHAIIIVKVSGTPISATLQVQVISDSIFDSLIKTLTEISDNVHTNPPQPILC